MRKNFSQGGAAGRSSSDASQWTAHSVPMAEQEAPPMARTCLRPGYAVVYYIDKERIGERNRSESARTKVANKARCFPTPVSIRSPEPRQFPRPALPLRCEARPVEIRGLAGQNKNHSARLAPSARQIKPSHKPPPCRTSKANNKTPPVFGAVQNSPSRKEGDKTASESSKYSSAESASINSPQPQGKIKPNRPA